MFLLCLFISSAFGFLPSRRPLRRPPLLSAIDPQIAEIIKSVIPLATFSAILTISNMRFADTQKAADQRFADNQKAADLRFADLIKSWTEIRGADKESLDVVVSGLKSDIKNAGGGLRPEN